MNHRPRLVVVGAGAVGGCLAALAHLAGSDVVVVARGEHGRVVRERGLRLRRPERDDLVPLACVEHVADVPWRVDDVAVLAVKAPDAGCVLAELERVAGSDVTVVCATNGVLVEPLAAQHFHCIVAGLVWVLATHLEPGEVLLHSQGELGVLDVGAHTPRAVERVDAVASALRATGLLSEVRADIARWKNAKWITNLGGAAQALLDGDWRSVAADARVEGERVLTAVGVEYTPLSQLLARVAGVEAGRIDGRERGGGSAWQSKERRRPLESDFIEGALFDLAQRHGLTAPVNGYLAELARSGRRADASAAPRG